MHQEEAQRAAYSERRLAELGKSIAAMEPLLNEAELCIYATGSYGRLEAWEGSDIDLFFLYENTESFSYLTFLRIAGCLIEATERMGFPPFSGDGQFLEGLDVREMERMLGSREDDSTNTFTARMLLLLESQPVSDERRYRDLLEQIVGFYYRDFPGHEDDFVPRFLINDILRFWRTLTLNYEHDRFAVRAIADLEERARKQAKSSLKNYKLKLSRLATCFSMVVHLACEQPPVTAQQVVGLCSLTPRLRFAALSGRTDKADSLLNEIDRHYERFLDQVQRPEPELIELFGEETSRREQLAEATRFGDLIYDLMFELAEPRRLRSLVI